MFSTTRFGWLRKTNQDDNIVEKHPSEKIIAMMYANEPEDAILKAIDALPLAILNQQIPSCSALEQYAAKAPLLRMVHEVCGEKRYKAQYSNIERHLLAKGVEQDVVYRWLTQPVSSEDKLFQPGSLAMSSSFNYHAMSYLLRLRAHSSANESEHVARIKGMIDAMTIDEINQPMFKTLDTTLLHLAAALGNVEITSYLLEKGANIEAKAKNRLGMTPLLFALASPYQDNDVINQTAALLLKEGADPMITTKGSGCVLGRSQYGNGETILDICMTRHNTQFAVQLLQSGLDSNHVGIGEHQAQINQLCAEHQIPQGNRFCQAL